MKWLLLISIVLSTSVSVFAQSFTYSYVNPCNGNTEKIIIPTGSNSVAVTYYNQIRVFSEADFMNGTFDSWASSVFNTYSQISPCAGIGTTTVVSITQNTAMNLISIMGSLTTISDAMGSINSLGGTTSSVSNGTGSNSRSKKKAKNENTQQSVGGSTGSTSSSSQSTGSTSQGEQLSSGKGSSTGSAGSSTQTSSASQQSQSGSTQGGSSQAQSTVSPNSNSQTSTSQSQPKSETAGGSGTGSSSTGSQSSTSTNSSGETAGGTGTGSSSTSSGTSSQSQPKSETAGGSGAGAGPVNKTSPTVEKTATDKPKTDLLSGSNSAVQSTPTNGTGNSKNGLKPTIVAGSDLAGFNFKDGNVEFGGKINGNYTSVRYDQRRSHGIIFDYTTAIKGPNVTAFYAWMKPRRINLISNTFTAGFEGKGSIYNTVALGQMRDIGKSKRLKVVYMASSSFGKVYHEPFIGTALIAGGMYDWRVSKKFDVKLMALAVYAPYVSYYNDILLKSPYVVLPSIGTNLKITKNFRFNINWGGAWAINQNVLNYTVTIGTRLVL